MKTNTSGVTALPSEWLTFCAISDLLKAKVLPATANSERSSSEDRCLVTFQQRRLLRFTVSSFCYLIPCSSGAEIRPATTVGLLKINERCISIVSFR